MVKSIRCELPNCKGRCHSIGLSAPIEIRKECSHSTNIERESVFINIDKAKQSVHLDIRLIVTEMIRTGTQRARLILILKYLKS